MMTTSAAAGRLATRCSARRPPSWWATPSWPERSRSWPPDVTPADRAARSCAVLAHAAGATALVGGQASDLAGGVTGRRHAFARIDPPPQDGRPDHRVARAGRHRRPAHRPSNSPRSKQYGRHLGLAFQITDDLLDVSGNQADVGKRLAKDADHGKATYPQLLGIEESRDRAAAARRPGLRRHSLRSAMPPSRSSA